MGDVKEFDTEAILCRVCKKRKATRLCDAITGYSRYAGHPPKINGSYSNEPMESVITCDLPICDRCSTKVTEFMDLCPEHSKPLIKQQGCRKRGFMEYKVFRINEFDWVVAKSEDDAVEWYEKQFGEPIDRNEVRECDLEKEGQYVEFEDAEKIAELEAKGLEEVRVPDENGMNGFGSLIKRSGEWYIKVPFKDVLPTEETEPYVTATTEW